VIRKKLVWLAVFVALACAQPALAQKYVPDPDTGNKIRAATQPVTIVARIGYSLEYGGYYVMNNPRHTGNKVILNQNYKVLKALHREHRAIAIRGRVAPADFLATHIFIERLDGQPYHGSHAPETRLPLR
jgi:hypothetical protein